MKILRIGPSRGKLGCQQVVLEGGMTFSLRPTDVTALGLHAGTGIEEGMLEQLRERKDAARAAEMAYRLLAVRMRTRGELADRLRRRGHTPEIVYAVLNELERVGLLDDDRFAETWVRGRMALRPSGAARLRWELVQKGVAREVIDRTLHHTLSAQDESTMAVAVARARLPRYRGAPREVAYRRLAGVLQRRGFSPAVVAQVLREVLGQSQLLVD